MCAKHVADYIVSTVRLAITIIYKLQSLCRSLCEYSSIGDRYYLSPQFISHHFKMASTWRYTLVCLDGVMDISTTD